MDPAPAWLRARLNLKLHNTFSTPYDSRPEIMYAVYYNTDRRIVLVNVVRYMQFYMHSGARIVYFMRFPGHANVYTEGPSTIIPSARPALCRRACCERSDGRRGCADE